MISLLGISRDIAERKQAEEVQSESELRFRQLAEKVREFFWVIDAADYRFLYISPAYEEIWGRTRETLYEQPRSWLKAVHLEDREHVEATLQRQMTTGEFSEEYRIVRPDGSVRWIAARSYPVRDEAKHICRIVGVAEDITERKHLQEQLIHTQKMESVGRLAGGVAHDFNNMLTAIINYTHLATKRASGSGAVGEYLREVQIAAERATRLTSQLLAFSRRQVIAPRVLDLNEIIADTSNMLRRLIGEDIELVTLLGAELGLVNVDPGHIEQVLFNLVVNAQDAMPEGGKLTIETAKVRLGEDLATADPELAAGEYVILFVSDNGVGMTDEVRSHIFEPFYTTKEVGKGTGLGLSTSYGVVAQSGGGIEVQSQLGHGTTVKVYLPRVDAALQSVPLSRRGRLLGRRN